MPLRLLGAVVLSLLLAQGLAESDPFDFLSFEAVGASERAGAAVTRVLTLNTMQVPASGLRDEKRLVATALGVKHIPSVDVACFQELWSQEASSAFTTLLKSSNLGHSIPGPQTAVDQSQTGGCWCAGSLQPIFADFELKCNDTTGMASVSCVEDHGFNLAELPGACSACLSNFAGRLQKDSASMMDAFAGCLASTARDPLQCKAYEGFSGLVLASHRQASQVETRVLPSTEATRGIIYGKLQTKSGPNHVFCTHLSPSSGTGYVANALFSSYEEENQAQVKAVLDFVKEMAGDEAAIVLGDFNNGPSIPESRIAPKTPANYELLLNGGLENVYTHQNEDDVIVQCSWCWATNALVPSNMTDPSAEQGCLVDHIFVQGWGGSARVVRGFTADTVVHNGSLIPVSDHYGLVADLVTTHSSRSLGIGIAFTALSLLSLVAVLLFFIRERQQWRNDKDRGNLRLLGLGIPGTQRLIAVVAISSATLPLVARWFTGIMFLRIFNLPFPHSAPYWIRAVLFHDLPFYDIVIFCTLAGLLNSVLMGIIQGVASNFGALKAADVRLRFLACACRMQVTSCATSETEVKEMITTGTTEVETYWRDQAFWLYMSLARMALDILLMFFLDWRFAMALAGPVAGILLFHHFFSSLFIRDKEEATRTKRLTWLSAVLDAMEGLPSVVLANMSPVEITKLRQHSDQLTAESLTIGGLVAIRQFGAVMFMFSCLTLPWVVTYEGNVEVDRVFVYVIIAGLVEDLHNSYDNLFGPLEHSVRASAVENKLAELEKLTVPSDGDNAAPSSNKASSRSLTPSAATPSRWTPERQPDTMVDHAEGTNPSVTSVDLGYVSTESVPAPDPFVRLSRQMSFTKALELELVPTSPEAKIEAQESRKASPGLDRRRSLRLALALDDPNASFPPGSLWPNVPGSPTSPGRVNAFSRSQLKATALPLLDIVIENIVTGYLQPWSAPPILDGVAAVIPAGSVIGIVGETGSGKTTLLKTLIGMLPPWDGDIVIGSHKLEDVVQRWWNSICLIPQHGHLFARTIRENICYGLSNVPQDKVEAAAKKAMAHDFITKKEKGYDHILAPGGTDLSGGQRQRIHLARAFLRKSRYLFLDEPTSALDNATQDQIIANLNELLHLQKGEKRSRTCVVVTHRTEVLHMYEGRITKVEARNKQPAPGSFPMPVATAFPNETSPKRQDNANEMMPVVMLPDWEHHNVDTGLHSNGTSSTIQADYGAAVPAAVSAASLEWGSNLEQRPWNVDRTPWPDRSTQF